MFKAFGFDELMFLRCLDIRKPQEVSGVHVLIILGHSWARVRCLACKAGDEGQFHVE